MQISVLHDMGFVLKVLVKKGPLGMFRPLFVRFEIESEQLLFRGPLRTDCLLNSDLGLSAKLRQSPLKVLVYAKNDVTPAWSKTRIAKDPLLSRDHLSLLLNQSNR